MQSYKKKSPPRGSNAPERSGLRRWLLTGAIASFSLAAFLLPIVACVHSIDSLRLAEELDIAAARITDPTASSSTPPRKIPVLLQVNASEEPQKFGVAVGAAAERRKLVCDVVHGDVASRPLAAEDCAQCRRQERASRCISSSAALGPHVPAS